MTFIEWQKIRTKLHKLAEERKVERFNAGVYDEPRYIWDFEEALIMVLEDNAKLRKEVKELKDLFGAPAEVA